MANIIKQLKDSNGNNIYPIAYAQGGVKMDLLWTNPNPTSSFSAQTVTCDTSYSMYLVDCRTANNSTNIVSNMFVNGTSFCVNNGTNSISRNATVGANGITFSDGYLGGNANNNMVIPYHIYGIKMSYIVPTTVNGLQYVEV